MTEINRVLYLKNCCPFIIIKELVTKFRLYNKKY